MGNSKVCFLKNSGPCVGPQILGYFREGLPFEYKELSSTRLDAQFSFNLSGSEARISFDEDQILYLLKAVPGICPTEMVPTYTTQLNQGGEALRQVRESAALYIPQAAQSPHLGDPH